MRIALLYPPSMLSFRGSLELSTARQDPRGMTGSEYGYLRIAEELAAMGHDVHMYVASPEKEWAGCTIHEWREGAVAVTDCDVVISVNSPDDLRCTTGLRVCLYWINNFSICKVGFENHVDLWCSPSQPHLDQVMTNPEWRAVEVTPTHPAGKAEYVADPSKWCVLPLGCDPEHYPPTEKVPGRVVYCSSPDRGLHWLLQEWQAIKKAAPHANLKIFYRLQPWIDGFKNVAYFPPIERLRARANYIEDALKRLSDPKWAIEVCDSVSRDQIEREMSMAEVLAYPCDTTAWSEGFSCTTLEGCAARACPVIMDCDALGDIYRGAICVADRGDVDGWRDHVIRMLTSKPDREEKERAAVEFAAAHTWKRTAERLMEQIDKRLTGRPGQADGFGTSESDHDAAIRSDCQKPSAACEVGGEGPTTDTAQAGSARVQPAHGTSETKKDESTLVKLPPCFINEAGLIQNLVEHDCGGVAVIRSEAGAWRSNHWHKTDWHYLYVVDGTMFYWERPVRSDEKPRRKIVKSGEMVFTGPRVEHATWFPEPTLIVSVSKLSRQHEQHEADLIRLATPLVDPNDEKERRL